MASGSLLIVAARSTAVVMLLTGCASLKETTYEGEFDPPRTYIDFMGARVPREMLDQKLIEDGLGIAQRLGFDVEFVTAVNSVGCDDLCFVYRQKHVDDVFIVMTARQEQRRFRRWFHFSPLDSGSP
jgi:hypothetical protein